jgi:hypothetical protein
MLDYSFPIRAGGPPMPVPPGGSGNAPTEPPSPADPDKGKELDPDQD